MMRDPSTYYMTRLYYEQNQAKLFMVLEVRTVIIFRVLRGGVQGGLLCPP